MRREEVADGEPDRELVQRRRQPRGEGVHACGQCSNLWGGWVEAFGQGEEGAHALRGQLPESELWPMVVA